MVSDGSALIGVATDLPCIETICDGTEEPRSATEEISEDWPGDGIAQTSIETQSNGIAWISVESHE